MGTYCTQHMVAMVSYYAEKIVGVSSTEPPADKDSCSICPETARYVVTHER